MHLDDVGGNSLGLRAQSYELRFVLRIDGDLTVGEVDCCLAEDVVFAEFAEAFVIGSDCGLVGGDLLLLGGELGLLGLQGCLLRGDLIWPKPRASPGFTSQR